MSQPPTPPTLTTERLILRALQANLDHAQGLLPVWQQPLARRFTTVPQMETPEEVLEHIKGLLCPAGARRWLIQHRDKDEIIGELGFLGNAGHPGFGWTISPVWWRQGFGKEAARAALGWGFDAHLSDTDLIEIWTHPHNVASRRLAASLGFERVDLAHNPTAPHPNDRLVEVWQLHRDTFIDGQPFASTPRFASIRPVLPVQNLQKELGFFLDTLGFVLAWTSPALAIVQRGEIQLHLSASSRTEPEQPHTLRLQLVCLEAYLQELESRGASLAWPLRTQPWGIREALITTPGGHRLILTEGL